MFGSFVLKYCDSKGLSIYKYSVHTLHLNYFNGIEFSCPCMDITFSDEVESESICY